MALGVRWGRRGVEVAVEMSLGRRGDYAVRAILDLARVPGTQRKAREISEAMAVPINFLSQILAQLVRAGFVASTAGPHGGYGLISRPADISLLDVITAVEGEHGEPECVLRGGPCVGEDRCAVHLPWSRAQQAFRAELAATTFEELVALDQRPWLTGDAST